MALYVVPIDMPAPGVDWSVVVPGQYLWNVTGITATLDNGNPTVAVDSSGNGHDGTYDGFQVFVPGLVAGDTAVQLGPGALPFGLSHVTIPPVMPDLTAGFTFEFWAASVNPGQSWQAAICYLTAPPYMAGVLEIFGIAAGGNDGIVRINAYTIDWQSDPVTNLFDGNPHFVTIASDGATNFTIKVDAVTIPSAEVGGPNPFTNFAPITAAIGSGGAAPNLCLGILDEFAIYDQELGSLQVDAHYAAASVSFPAYTAAILADAPVAFYHLDSNVGAGRQVDLLVTNGTSEVLEIPTGFAAPAGSGPFGYSWSPTLRSSTQTPTSEAIAVAIPRLIVPAGYTIGTRTLDIGASDQWSAVTLWWDSDYQDRQHPIDPYAFPPGALLKFVQTGGQP